MQKFKTLSDCIALAEFAHRNQFDKAGMPYIHHPQRVLRAVQEQGASPHAQMAAILHDITEDTAFTIDMLRQLGVPSEAVEIVALVDRDVSRNLYMKKIKERSLVLESWTTGEHPLDDVELTVALNDYDTQNGIPHDAEKFYYQEIRKNPDAVQVKLADIEDNMLPWRLSYLPEKTQERLNRKYTNGIQLLTQ